MLAAVTRYDSFSIVLFHLGHVAGDSWEIEIHGDGEFSNLLLATTSERGCKRIPISSIDGPIFVRCRKAGHRWWRQVALRQLTPFRVRFGLRAKVDLELLEGIAIVGLIGDDIVAFSVPEFDCSLSAGQTCEIVMEGVPHYVHGIALKPGELFVTSDRFDAINLGPVEGGLEATWSGWKLSIDRRVASGPSFLVKSSPPRPECERLEMLSLFRPQK